MKAVFGIIVFAIVLATTTARYSDGHDGRPLCMTDYELTRPWRNNNDPTRFWACRTRGEPGVMIKCPQEQGFYDTNVVFGCVPFSEWQWLKPYDPPSMAF